MAKETIKIPTKHYVGMVKRGDEKLPLAFITPHGEDAASIKRIKTVDDWVSSNGRYGGNKALSSMTIDNVPLSGFKLTADIRSSSYGGLDKWRIEDPRGFELEITSGNLARLLSVGMIDRGEINDQCVWGRDGANNVLISVNTNEYKVAVENTAVAGLKADWKNAKPGNTVLLQNNVRGVWLGRMHTLMSYRDREQSALGNSELISTDKSLHVILIDEPASKHGGYTKQLLLVSSPKLAAIEDATAMTEAEAEVMANKLVADRHCQININSYKTVIALTFGSVQAGKISLVTKPADIADEDHLRSIINDYNRRNYIYAVQNGNFGRVTRRYDRTNPNAFGLAAFCQQSLASGELRAVNKSETGTGYWDRARVTWSQMTLEHTWTADNQYLNLVATIETKTGNHLEVLL